MLRAAARLPVIIVTIWPEASRGPRCAYRALAAPSRTGRFVRLTKPPPLCRRHRAAPGGADRWRRHVHRLALVWQPWPDVGLLDDSERSGHPVFRVCDLLPCVVPAERLSGPATGSRLRAAVPA